MKKNIFKSNGFQSLLASLLCIVLGLFLGCWSSIPLAPARRSLLCAKTS